MVRQRDPDGGHHAGYLIPGTVDASAAPELRVLAATGAGLVCVANC
jgi:hypothetical protein